MIIFFNDYFYFKDKTNEAQEGHTAHVCSKQD